jgi:hypothetical protein
MGSCNAIGSIGKVIHNYKMSIEKYIYTINKKIGVFKIGQHRQINNNRHCQQQLSFGLVLRLINPFSGKIVKHDTEQHQEEEKTAGFIIKENAQNKKITGPDAAVFVFVNQRIAHQNKSKKSPEKETGKNKRSRRIV